MNAVLKRLASVDALRGCTVALMLLVNDPGDWAHVYWPLEHAEWNGCTPTDLVFPFFLFVVGVSIALATGPRVEQGADRSALARAALKRAARILLLGVAINVLAWLIMPGAHLRFPGVLQRIGVCFAGAALFAIYTKPRVQWAIIAVLLLGYWGLLLAGGTLEPFANIVSRTDFAIFGHTVYLIDPVTGRGHDPEGLLGCLPSLATSLLGLRAGQWLREENMKALTFSGIVWLLLGFAWSLMLPLNKNLWTSSFVLWTAGWATIALVVFHMLIDQRGWPAIGRRFGVNAVAAYAGSELMQILLPGLHIQNPLYQHVFASWLTPLAGAYVASLAFAVVFVAAWWVIVYVMDRRKIYLKL
ncbi:heparan-alpha-glucosaminide N-acetyltransferase domain-containing protein [Dyella sp.]|uniref:acyltransferase family protein n=1 Tax=Dyella sp. TaxID=1869338 RepID=UPI00284C8A9E|nr:heparan-alpha-glucosaminide N-acetyltransferase domain-containing protein [Dyella sp.]MDR3447346.1 heparan-alpha-glucosaminide N-acetyltransferase domain-containing protein [Dyella sp.]